MFGVTLVGIMDFQSMGYGHWSRFLIGGLAVLIGFGVDLWGIKTLTAQQSLGDKGKIITEGPYQYTRNPQYVGFILFYAGLILLTYSYMALAAGLLLILAFRVLPFSEEPWLRQQYGEPFEEYCKQVPRFIGVRSFKRTFPNTSSQQRIKRSSPFQKRQKINQHIWSLIAKLCRKRGGR